MKNKKVTPQNITKLKKNEIFVFGSNQAGVHGAGAAKLALDKFGAIYGNGLGIQGQSFAIPTKDKNINTLPLPEIQEGIHLLVTASKLYPKLTFLVTEIGCGLAGYKPSDIAPLFKEVVGIENISLPQSFLDILIKPTIKGYKVTNSKMQCCPGNEPFQYELNKIYVHTGVISPCNTGFHYCQQLADCFGYYNFTTENRVFEIIDHGTPVLKEDKSCTNSIELIRELSWLEVLELCNMGKGNSGIRNAGNDNAGNRNAGNYNVGNDNAGNRNAGNYNAGNYNAGNRNAGYSNAGNDNAGAFNNLVTPNYMLFNKPSNWTYGEFTNSPAYLYLQQVDTTLWIPDYKMTDEEKKLYPYFETTKGYVKNIPYKEAFQNSWNNWNEKARQSFKDLPNFDSSIFFDITGIQV